LNQSRASSRLWKVGDIEVWVGSRALTISNRNEDPIKKAISIEGRKNILLLAVSLVEIACEMKE